jgi:hypothetical protein
VSSMVEDNIRLRPKRVRTEERKISEKKYYQKNKEKIIKYQIEYQRKLLEKNPEYNMQRRTKINNLLYDILTPEGQTPKCALCDCVDTRQFHIDHINGDRREDIEKFRHDILMKIYYTKHPDEARKKLQILCYSHHVDKTRMDNRRKH